jgi:hypothetical protein
MGAPAVASSNLHTDTRGALEAFSSSPRVRTLPCHMHHLLGIRPPESDSPMPHANDGAHALGPCVELRMPQCATGEFGRFLLVNIKVDQAIAGVTQSALEKTRVETKEGRPVQPVEQAYDVPIFHT